jgi:carboxyl-terminal processing protease
MKIDQGGFMSHRAVSGKAKILIFAISFIILLYGASAAFFAKEAYKELGIFMEALRKINDEYVEVPDMNKVHEGALRGLFDALDPYSAFLTREQFAGLEKRSATDSAGADMVVSRRSDVIYVVSVQAQGAADNAGIRPGDYLLSVNGEEIGKKNLLEVNHLLRGTPGTIVRLSVFRGSQTVPQDIEITLQEPAQVKVTSKILDGNIGYLQIASLTGASVEQAKVGLKTLVSAGVGRILLDLRNCAEGEPAQGAEVANFFLKEGVVYFSQDRNGEKLDVVTASPEKFVTDLPAALLINGSTAGAAEIIAGALKDHNRARLVGEKTFGAGSSQKTIKLKSGAAMIISTAKYCTPNGNIIQAEAADKAGIEPDFESPDASTRQDLAVESYYDYDEGDDNKYRKVLEKIRQIQLDKAIEVLSGAENPAEPLKKAA